MRDLWKRWRPYLWLLFCRAFTLVVIVLATVNLADVYLEFLAAVFCGVLGGLALALSLDAAAVQYGRRLGRIEMREHAARQAAARAAAEAPRSNAPPTLKAPTAAVFAASLAGVKTAVGAELAAAIAAGVPPLDVVQSVLEAGPAEGMTPGQVAAEVSRRRDFPCTDAQAVGALAQLLAGGRAFQPTWRGEIRVAPSSSLKRRILDVVGAAPGGLTASAIAVTAGYQLPTYTVWQAAEALVKDGQLVRDADGRYQPPPF